MAFGYRSFFGLVGAYIAFCLPSSIQQVQSTQALVCGRARGCNAGAYTGAVRIRIGVGGILWHLFPPYSLTTYQTGTPPTKLTQNPLHEPSIANDASPYMFGQESVMWPPYMISPKMYRRSGHGTCRKSGIGGLQGCLKAIWCFIEFYGGCLWKNSSAQDQFSFIHAAVGCGVLLGATLPESPSTHASLYKILSA